MADVLIVQPRAATGQPCVVPTINRRNPLAVGLAYANSGTIQNQGTWVGSKQTATSFGVANGFGSTLGTGTTDSIETAFNRHATQRTFLVFAMALSGGASNAGRIVDKRTGADGQVEVLTMQNSAITRGLSYYRNWTGAAVEWRSPANAIVFGRPFSFAATYDSSSTANNALLYVDGSSVTATAIGTPSGSLVNNTSNYVIGNRKNDNARNFDGWVGPIFIWDRILSPEEIAAVSANPWQLFSWPLYLPFVTGGGGDVTVSITGVSASGAVGNLAASIAVALSGVQATGQVGNVSVGGDVTVSITGVQATTAVGTVIPGLSISVTGVNASGAVGSVTHSHSVTLQGVRATGQVGTVTASGGVVQLRQKGLRKTRYVPQRPSVTSVDLAQFIQSEFERVADGLESPFTHELLDALAIEPARKLDGKAIIVYADGTNWDPGSGEGIYAYYGGSWNKLG